MNSVNVGMNAMASWPHKEDVINAQKILEMCVSQAEGKLSLSELCCDGNMHHVSSLMITFGLLSKDSLGNVMITERGEHIHRNGWQ